MFGKLRLNLMYNRTSLIHTLLLLYEISVRDLWILVAYEVDEVYQKIVIWHDERGLK